MQDIKREYLESESTGSILNLLNITWEYVEYARHQVGVSWLKLATGDTKWEYAEYAGYQEGVHWI